MLRKLEHAGASFQEVTLAVVGADHRARSLHAWLQGHGHQGHLVAPGDAALWVQRQQGRAVVLLFNGADTMPSVVQQVQRRGVVLVALANDEDAEIEALEAGADLVLPSPLNLRLLRARFSALRRHRQGGAPNADAGVRCGVLHLDKAGHRFSVAGQPITLTPKELDLMSHLMDRPGVCCSRQDLLEAVWGIDFETGTNMVDVYIFYLRKKLKAAGQPRLIHTVRGKGYRLELPAAQAGATSSRA